jgi:hypothetical protein
MCPRDVYMNEDFTPSRGEVLRSEAMPVASVMRGRIYMQ